MTRTQAWDRVWHRLESQGIPITHTQAKAKKQTSAFYLFDELCQLSNIPLSLEAIELLGEIVSSAYALGRDDQANVQE